MLASSAILRILLRLLGPRGACAADGARGAAGFLYPQQDYAACLAATRQLVEDDTMRQRMGQAAREEVSLHP